MKKIFVCINDYEYGNYKDKCFFIKDEKYIVEFLEDDYKEISIKITDHYNHWIRFYINSGFHTEHFIPNFIELSKYRKQKIEKLMS